MKKLTTKTKVLNALKRTNGKPFSYKRLAKKVGITENSFRCWLWCLEYRDNVVAIYKNKSTVGIAEAIF